ncbi:MAG: flavodoxin family protein [Beduini sp.]|uniref:flavodoxin family protein n=1 Tax=Beduini sp. TaxID=1922300 RepID=UPI0011CBEA7A
MSKILVVVGSGTKMGNTDQLADSFIKGATEAGHQVHKVNLTDHIEGCRGCGACQLNGNQCALNDIMQEIYPLFREAEILVMASPLYFWSISGRLKSFIDRLYAISTNDEYPHKDTMLLMTSGSKGFYAFEQAVSFYRFFINALGWTDRGMILAKGCKGEQGHRFIEEHYLLDAYRLGKTI